MTGLKTAEVKVGLLSGLDKLIERQQKSLRWELAEDKREAGLHVTLSAKAGCVPSGVLESEAFNAAQVQAQTEQLNDLVSLRDYARMMLPDGGAK